MPIIDKRDRNNWYNCIRIANRDEYNPLADPNFDPETYPESEFRFHNGTVMAKIPKIEHRIFKESSPEGYQTHIIFVADAYYDKEKRQMRNKKVSLGTDLEGIVSGWMLVNTDNYYTYFDKEGHLKYDPLQERREQKEKENSKFMAEKKDISFGSQIRSYVFCPYTMVKDHRTRHSVGNIQAVMDGDLDDFMNAYLVAKWKGLPMDGSGDDDDEE